MRNNDVVVTIKNKDKYNFKSVREVKDAVNGIALPSNIISYCNVADIHPDNNAHLRHVFGYDLIHDKTSIGISVSSNKLKLKTKIYCVELSNGSLLYATPNTKILDYSGEFINIEDLKEDTVVKYHDKVFINKNEYLYNHKDAYILTDNLVYELMAGEIKGNKKAVIHYDGTLFKPKDFKLIDNLTNIPTKIPYTKEPVYVVSSKFVKYDYVYEVKIKGVNAVAVNGFYVYTNKK